MLCNPFIVDKSQDREYVDTPTAGREYGISCQDGYEPRSTDSERGPARRAKSERRSFKLSHICAAAGGAKRVLVIEKLGYTVQTYRCELRLDVAKYEDHQHGVKTVS